MDASQRLVVKAFPHPLTLSSNFGTLDGGLGSFPLGNGTYLPLPDSRAVVRGIRSLVGFGSPVRPLAHPVLYLRRNSPEAIPQYISARTSYLPA